MEPKAVWRKILVCLVLGLGTVAIYSPTFHFDFTNYDDPAYVVENPRVNQGVTAAGLGWAFQAGYAANWHPLTWMSHMLDCQIFGLRAGGHHATNVLLHASNAILLFLLLARMTETFWRSAMVAALFAWHPMHVESVAWISERKDVLSSLLWILALWAYVRYAQGLHSKDSRTKLFYALALALFVLGLMAKPMVITLPFVLLLLDWWPLRRQSPAVKLLLEKTPFFLFAAAAGWVTILAQSREHALSSLQRNPFSIRVLNSFLCYLRYAEKLVWPAKLSVIYTFYYRVKIGEVALAVGFLSVMFAIAILARKSRPYWMFGWLWYLGTLVPVIGLMQVGAQSMADRYMYLPSIGIFILVCWTAGDLVRGWHGRGALVTAGAFAVLASCVVATEKQISFWKNSGTLFGHALALDSDNYVAHVCYGDYLADQGEFSEALAECQKAVELAPDYLPGFRCLAKALTMEGTKDPAMAARAYAEARPELKLGVLHNPNDANLRHLLGTSLALEGYFAAAEQQFAACVRLAPDQLGCYYDLAQAMTAQGKTSDAIAVYRALLQSHPDNADALDDLAWIFAANANPQVRNGAEAVQLALRACELTQTNDAMKVGTLAAACAEAGRFGEAVSWAEKARQVAQSHGQTGVAARILEEQKLYKARLTFHENP
ncbi:MAG TPA: tetratricopeptide repeat protein [Verrucomicrobiae bacterium]|jgi:tetratricopeptide (TPR) repeat protein|nr:tetratricopeptide repeat protein [Verrucomicrobiae bacterium]